jgi:hypothetical protein
MIGDAPHARSPDLATGGIPSGWSRTDSGFVAPTELANNIESPSPLALLLADKIRQSPSWMTVLDKWAMAATRAANAVVGVVETATPTIERASQLVVRVADSPKTVQVLETFIALLIVAEEINTEVEAEGGGTEAFVKVVARMHLRQAGVELDAFIRSKLQQLVSEQGDDFTIRYLMNLLNRHRIRLRRPAELERIAASTQAIRQGIKGFGSIRLR